MPSLSTAVRTCTNQTITRKLYITRILLEISWFDTDLTETTVVNGERSVNQCGQNERLLRGNVRTDSNKTTNHNLGGFAAKLSPSPAFPLIF